MGRITALSRGWVRRRAGGSHGRGVLGQERRGAAPRREDERKHQGARQEHVPAAPASEWASAEWRERVGIEPTGAAGGASVAVLKTGQTTRPDPPP